MNKSNVHQLYKLPIKSHCMSLTISVSRIKDGKKKDKGNKKNEIRILELFPGLLLTEKVNKFLNLLVIL